jgi:hypothetical protein
MSVCAFCGKDYKESDEGIIKLKKKRGVCKPCTTDLIDGLFSNKEFNEWLDSFMQSRLVRYIPGYDEYFVRHKKRPCPDCKGTGWIEGKVCKRCNFVGVIAATE